MPEQLKLDLKAPAPDAAPSAEAVPAAVNSDSQEAAAVPTSDDRTWGPFDLGRALQELRSLREGVVRCALRKLHIRWHHAPAQQMKTLLTAAGLSSDVLSLVPQIVDTCQICRAWSKPGPRAMMSSEVPVRFNEQVQMDLLFYKSFVIIRMLDVTARFTVAHQKQGT